VGRSVILVLSGLLQRFSLRVRANTCKVLVTTSGCSNTRAVGETAPAKFGQSIERGQGLFWSRRSGKPILVSTIQPRQDRQRHSRKYAEGELGEDKSFYFRGPDGALNLRAQNLALFLQIAEGIDDRTWLHHLRAGDYSQWLRDKIKDAELAEEVARIEGDEALTPLESRRRIKEAIESRYTSPA